MMIQVDPVNTHNILQPRIATHLKLPTTPCPPFSVMVGNGAHIQCNKRCPAVPLTIQGADVVLGIEWLDTLGPIQANFATPSITFTHHNETLTIYGDTTSYPKTATYHQICHMLTTNSIASLHLLSIEP